jgi:hypothetical protein
LRAAREVSELATFAAVTSATTRGASSTAYCLAYLIMVSVRIRTSTSFSMNGENRKARRATA